MSPPFAVEVFTFHLACLHHRHNETLTKVLYIKSGDEKINQISRVIRYQGGGIYPRTDLTGFFAETGLGQLKTGQGQV